MDITRRRFLINTGIAVSALAIPKMIISSKNRIYNNQIHWGNFSREEAENLDQYNLNKIIPSIISFLLFASMIDGYSFVFLLLFALFFHNLNFLSLETISSSI
jgi:hypothetical protein